MLLSAKDLTGYVRKDCQVKWLNEHGFKHGAQWFEQKKNGKIVVIVAESVTPSPVVKLNLSALGPQKDKAKTSSRQDVSSARKVSTKAS